MLFFGSLLLIFMLFCNEIEASDENLILGLGKTNNVRNRVTSLGTSRLTMPSASRRNPTAREHDALDLHRYQPDILESSQQTRSKEVLDLANKYKMRHEHYSQGSSSSRMIPNDQVQYPEQKFTQKHASQENIDWLIEHFRYGTPPVIGGQRRRKRHQKTQEEKELDARMSEARRVYALPFREHSKLIQTGLRQDNRQLYDRKDYKDEDSIKHFSIHYPNGLPYPLPQPQFVNRNHLKGSGPVYNTDTFKK